MAVSPDHQRDGHRPPLRAPVPAGSRRETRGATSRTPSTCGPSSGSSTCPIGRRSRSATTP